MGIRVGILAIQGDVEAHARALAAVGADAVPVKRAPQLDAVDALILPGGESTTIAKGLDRLGMYEPIEAFAILRNAVEACCESGTVEVTTHRDRLLQPREGYEDIAAGEYAVVSVKDTGEGIADEHLPRIFEPYYSRKQMGVESGNERPVALH